MTTACGALTSMGFRQREAQQLVEAVRSRVSEDDSVEAVIRYALRAAPAPTCVREAAVEYARRVPWAPGPPRAA